MECWVQLTSIEDGNTGPIHVVYCHSAKTGRYAFFIGLEDAITYVFILQLLENHLCGLVIANCSSSKSAAYLTNRGEEMVCSTSSVHGTASCGFGKNSHALTVVAVENFLCEILHLLC